MSLSDRRTFLLLGALALAGCGFTPALAPGGPGNALLGGVQMEAPTDKDGFDFVARLEDRLGRSDAPAYRLGYQIATRSQGLGITPTGSITRYNLDGGITYALRDVATDAVVASGRVESFTSWSATGSTLSTLTAEDDARRRLMQILADQIVTRLIAAGVE